MKTLNCGLLTNSYIYFTEDELNKLKETINNLIESYKKINLYYISGDIFINECFKIIEKEKNSSIYIEKINQEEFFNKIDLLLLYEKPYSKRLHTFISTNTINICN